MHPTQPQINNPLDTAIKAQQLRQLQLQNQQMQQELRNSQQLPSPAPVATTSSPTPQPPANSQLDTYRAVYGCSVTLSNAVSRGLTEADPEMRRTLDTAECNVVRRLLRVGETSLVETPPPALSDNRDVGNPLDNAEVVKMVKAKYNEDTIIWEIGFRPPHYALAQADMDALRGAGVSVSIIQAMIEKSAGR